MLSLERMQRAASFFKLLSKVADTAPLMVAAGRINESSLRSRPEDAILDLTIALEALLSDGSQELTYKLALRVAAIVRINPSYPRTSSEAFREIKAIYGYRSSIVHGKPNRAKEIVQKSFAGEAVGPLRALRSYVGLVIWTQLRSEKYRVPSEIDHLLLS
jgi:hypothetical protein